MTRYAAGTKVDQAASRAEIERILKRYGASTFAYMTQPDKAAVAFSAHGRSIRFTIPYPSRSAAEFTYSSRGLRAEATAMTLWEAACRQRWRALTLLVKAKLEAIECGIVTFDDAFLADTVLPGGDTVAERLGPEARTALLTHGRMPLLLEGPKQ